MESITLSMEDGLQGDGHYARAVVAIKLGIVASLSYHFFCQFPAQAEVSRCLLAIASVNVLFGILKLIGPTRTLSNFSADLVVFNVTLVKPSRVPC